MSMMKNNEYIKFCRYYKGEDKCPLTDANERALWFYERAWTFDAVKKESKYNDEIIINYIHAGLASFHNDDGVPLFLKAYLFHSLQKWGSGVELFKKDYEKYYK